MLACGSHQNSCEWRYGRSARASQQMGSQMRPVDNFLTRTNIPILIGLSIHNIPINIFSLKWGDKSPSFAWGRILCAQKRQRQFTFFLFWTPTTTINGTKIDSIDKYHVLKHQERLVHVYSYAGIRNNAVFFNFGSLSKITQIWLKNDDIGRLIPPI